MAQPTRKIPTSVLESLDVTVGGVAHSASVDRGSVRFSGGRGSPRWVNVVGDSVEVTLGAKVPELLNDIPPEERDEAVAAGAIVAAVIGHPRREERGEPVRFVWTAPAPLRLSERHARR
jgi:hypothetical protein